MPRGELAGAIRSVAVLDSEILGATLSALPLNSSGRGAVRPAQPDRLPLRGGSAKRACV